VLTNTKPKKGCEILGIQSKFKEKKEKKEKKCDKYACTYCHRKTQGMKKTN